MTVHHVIFTDQNMSRAAQLCVESSRSHGATTHSRFTPSNMGTWQEVLEHPEIFRQPENPQRAWGWWAWKPLIIRQELSWLPDGATLIYSDAGVEFINNVSHIIDRMDQDIFLFGNNWEHAHWCKADVVQWVWPDYSEYKEPFWERFGKQAQASVIFFRVSKRSRDFVAEWLHWCLFEGGRLVDDSPSRSPNHPEFREHRHDQAILTTLAYREGIKLHYWPATYNDGAFNYEKLPCYAGDDYPILFHHHRRRNHEWENAA